MVGDLVDQEFPHHKSYQALWESRWKNACEKGIYPFAYGAVEDFELISNTLIHNNVREPYDWDVYAGAFAPRGEALSKAADEAEANGDGERAAELYLRASAVYRISRYPILRSPKQFDAWRKGKAAFEKGQRLIEYGVRPVDVPYSHRVDGEGEVIPTYVHLPKTASASAPAPLVIIASGLDGYRTDNCTFAEGFSRMGVGLLVFEIPGTADCPALPSDGASIDRLIASIIDWCTKETLVDEKKLCLWGLSTGAGFALRSAHTMKDKLVGAVVQGGGCHRMFDREWLDKVDKLEYPFDLAESLAVKFGYGADVERFKAEAQDKFSLVTSGILDQPCARTLLINGTNDTIFPIDDMWLAMQHGNAKEARFFSGAGHMGEPFATPFIFKWIWSLLGCNWTEHDIQRAVKATITPIRYTIQGE